jgi:hypothetical protein
MKRNISSICSGNGLPQRIDKALEWLIYSRNSWKEKCIETKLAKKRQTQEIKRVKASRDEWKLSHIRVKLELDESKKLNFMLQNRIHELELQIKSKNNELDELKKKQ